MPDMRFTLHRHLFYPDPGFTPLCWVVILAACATMIALANGAF